MRFATWLDTFISEKGLDLNHWFEVDGPSGANLIPLGCLVEAMKAAPADEQRQLRNAIVRLDFYNAPVLPFFNHLAGAIAC